MSAPMSAPRGRVCLRTRSKLVVFVKLGKAFAGGVVDAGRMTGHGLGELRQWKLERDRILAVARTTHEPRSFALSLTTQGTRRDTSRPQQWSPTGPRTVSTIVLTTYGSRLTGRAGPERAQIWRRGDPAASYRLRSPSRPSRWQPPVPLRRPRRSAEPRKGASLKGQGGRRA